MLNKIQLTSSYPCHSTKKVNLSYIPDLVPIQKFERTCPICKYEWDITVTQLKHTEQLLINKLEWE